MEIETTVNGRHYRLDVRANEFLLDVLRDHFGLTGPKVSCGVQVCGTCTVLLDGQPVSSCCMLSLEMDGRTVTTIEGIRDEPVYRDIEESLVQHAAVQCGFCIPGMVTTLRAAMDADDLESTEDVRRALEGNLCRCTGYRSILAAACQAVGVTDQ